MSDPDALSNPPRSIMAPYRVLDGFLDEHDVQALLDYAIGRQADFAPTRVGRDEHGRIDPTLRVSLSLKGPAPFKSLLREKLSALVPALTAELQLTPIENPKIELQLVAHGDGAFYRRHIDTETASEKDHIRVLSGVYYFHREPRAFEGGCLRLYAIGDSDRFVDIEPKRNTLLVFPSWAPHEVLPVGCPSGAFRDSRFAVNCWVYGKREGVTS